jgi:WD40 repeat protein
MNERAIFIEALDRDTPADRVAYLDAACAGDPALRERVEALLRSHEAAGDFPGKLAPQRLAEEFGARGSDATRTAPSAPDGGEGLDFLAPSERPESLGRLGHYEVQALVGRGGMGVVLKAFDENLHRVVAVKVMAPQLAVSATARQRFIREARAAAAVTHDHIVTIHGVEEAGGLPYIVMQYVDGVSLQERLDRSGPLALREVLRIGMQTASGLAAAHKQGLVHRDIKPANILLENGVERVKITDFGLARAADDASLTQSGVVAGTPQYMSPEQAEGKPVDARSDLFSLGSVLYAMCAGVPPFRGSMTPAVLRRVVEDTPRPLREVNPEVPAWLAATVDRLHAKDPAVRFQSAAEVAELLGGHLAHLQHPSQVAAPEPLPAAPPARAEAPGPPARWHRWAVAAGVLLLVTAGLGLTEAAGVTKLRATAIRIFTPDGTLVVESDDPDVRVTIEGDGGLVISGAGAQEVRLRPGSYKVRAVKDGKPVTLDRDLVTISKGDKQIVCVRIEGGPTAEAKPHDWAVGEIRQHQWPGRGAYSACFSPEGKYYAATGVGGGEPQRPDTVRVWELASGKLVMEARGNNYARFTPDSKRLITPGPDKQIYIWDLATRQEVAHFGEHPDWFHLSQPSPDGKQILTSCPDGILRLWDIATGKEIARLEPDDKQGVPPALGVPCFCRDGKQAITADNTGTIRLWDLEQRKEIRRWQHPDLHRWLVTFSPDGRQFITFGSDSVHFWDVSSEKETRTVRLMGKVFAAGFSPDGSRLFYLVERDTTVRLLDLAGNKEIITFETPQWGDSVPHGAMGISPDGRYAVAASWAGVVYLWRLPDPPAQTEKK